MDWQPIATAPQDGTRILAYLVIRGIGFPWIDIISMGGMTWNCPNANQDAVDRGDVFPTHWMPLPAPPKE